MEAYSLPPFHNLTVAAVITGFVAVVAAALVAAALGTAYVDVFTPVERPAGEDRLQLLPPCNPLPFTKAIGGLSGLVWHHYFLCFVGCWGGGIGAHFQQVPHSPTALAVASTAFHNY